MSLLILPLLVSRNPTSVVLQSSPVPPGGASLMRTNKPQVNPDMYTLLQIADFLSVGSTCALTA